MHIAFTHREGIAISTITYNDDGELRPLIYRLSLAEMIVPVGLPVLTVKSRTNVNSTAHLSFLILASLHSIREWYLSISLRD